jgi:hypothetical protein
MNNPWSRWLNRMKQKLGQAPGRKPGRKPRRVVLYLETLEARDVPSTVTVNTTNDTNAANAALSPVDSSGNISIRSALEFLNTNPGTNDMIIVPAGHYLLTAAGGAGQGTAGSLLVTDANGVAIQGAGAASTLIDAQQLDRVMDFSTGFGTSNLLQGLTIENGLAPIGFFLGSDAAAGGGILDDSGALTIMNCVVTNNEAKGLTTTSGGGGTGYGGGIFDNAESDPLTIINSTISNNKAVGGTGPGFPGTGEGGGVYVYFSQLAIQNSTFSGNQALGGNGEFGGRGEGGGLFFVADDNAYSVSNSTFSGNTATGGVSVGQGSAGNGYGGAIFNNGSAREGIAPNRITNTTIANNQANGGSAQTSAGYGGGIYNDYGGEVGIGSTIIAKNTTNGGVGSGQDVFDTRNEPNQVITSLGFNLIGDDDQPSGDFTNGVNHDQVGGNGNPVIDPLLGPLQNNGGPTDTLALVLGSPAIDQGSNMFGDVNGNPLSFDQRGPNFFRTVDLPPPDASDGTDVGAFELQLIPIVIPTFTSKVQFLASDVTDPRGSLQAQTLFVNGLYQVLLHRAPDQAGLNGWVFLLQSGVPSSEVVSAIYQSAEHRGIQVDVYYQTFLHRTESPAERAAWVNAFLAGASEEAVETGFLLSSEYQASHASNTDFVTGLYTDLLGRPPDAGLAGWVQLLVNGASRNSVIQGFLRSTEYLGDVVQLDYHLYLLRAGSTAEIQGWVNYLLGSQASIGTVAQLILNSDEFFFNPP